MNIAFIIIFIVSSTIHLYASYKKNNNLRAMSKGFIVSALLGWYCTKTQSPLTTAILALFFSWLGDVLLIPKGVKWFTFGGIAFMISHICFILTYNSQVQFNQIPLVLIVLAAIIYTVLVAIIFKGLKPHLPNILFYPMFVYLMINGAMNCFAFYQLYSLPCTGTIITFIGAVSDGNI